MGGTYIPYLENKGTSELKADTKHQLVKLRCHWSIYETKSSLQEAMLCLPQTLMQYYVKQKKKYNLKLWTSTKGLKKSYEWKMQKKIALTKIKEQIQFFDFSKLTKNSQY